MKVRTLVLASLAAITSGVLACSGAVLDLGGTDGGSATDAGPDAADSSDVSPSPTSPIDGTWKGYVESFAFPSGSDAIEMTLKASGSTVTGTVVFGAGSPPPPPVDPDGPYPANYHAARTFPGEGFVFTLVGGTFDGSRFRGGAVTTELFGAWCALQKKTWDLFPDAGTYACLPNWGFSTAGDTCTSTNPQNAGETITYDCEKLDLCGGFVSRGCDCSATGCAPLALTPPGNLPFDLAFQGLAMDGTTTAFGNKNVHLKKQ